MRILLDTHILLWWLSDDRRLPDPIRDAVTDGSNAVYVSAISVAEIAIKGSLGKLESPGNLATEIIAAGLVHLPFTAEHADRLSELPWHHRDPFDRMLIAQAVVESLTLASVDPACRAYDVRNFRLTPGCRPGRPPQLLPASAPPVSAPRPRLPGLGSPGLGSRADEVRALASRQSHHRDDDPRRRR